MTPPSASANLDTDLSPVSAASLIPSAAGAGINLGESVKQTITLTHQNGSESTLELQVSEDNPIDEIELSQMWDDDNILEVDFSRD